MRTLILLSLCLPACDKEGAKVVVDDTDVGDDSGLPGAPEIEVSPLVLDLGRVGVGGTVSGTFLVSNLGDANLVSTLALAGNVGFAVDAVSSDLAPAESLTVTVSLTGVTLGDADDTVLVSSNDADEPAVAVSVHAVVTDDADQDGYTTDDCDDTDAAVHPGADEVWYDGVDQDCNGRSDFDQDGDGYDQGDEDCDDENDDVSAGTLENPTNGVDDDCDGQVDEALSEGDADGDGFSEVAGDCNDGDASVNPGAAETWYNGRDEDCSGGSDYDQDGDGHDTDAYGGDDCDDTLAGVNPDVDENWYDGVDQDCDGNDDDQDGDGFGYAEDCDDTDADENVPTTWYVDADGDGQGIASATVEACERPEGYADSATDCDDTDRGTYLDAPEYCDGIDNDCDGTVDDDARDASTWYQDADGDTFGNPDAAQATCDQPAGYVADGTDCDDTDATVYPGTATPEVSYNGIDDDCDGSVDDMVAADESSWTILGTSASHAIGDGGVHTSPDLDGDGGDELLLSATRDDSSSTNAGALSFHDVGNRGTDVAYTAGWLLVAGDEWSDAFGCATVLVGDVDGDGADEIVSGAYLHDTDEDDAGTVYTFDVSGRTGEQDVDNIRDGRIGGDDEEGWYGSALAAGDLDDDGGVDLVVGAPGEEDEGGRVYLYTAGDGWNDTDLQSDASTAEMKGVSDDDHLGSALVSADLDGDGVDDLVVCAPDSQSSRGECWFLTGADALAADGDKVHDYDSASFTGSRADDALGDGPLTVAAGDLDGDGTADLALGLPGYDGTHSGGGGVMVARGGTLSGSYSPSSVDLLLDGPGALGASVSIPGDLDGDGDDDLLLGAPDYGAGVVYLVANPALSGTLSLPGDASASWSGQVNGDDFGAAAGGLLDLDNDGTLDFAAAATGFDTSSGGAGKVYVLPAY